MGIFDIKSMLFMCTLPYVFFINEVKGLNSKCVYNMVYIIKVTCRLLFFTKGKPLIVFMFLQNKMLDYKLVLGTTYF